MKRLSLSKDLQPLKEEALARIDAQAGAIRSRYITVTPGQDLVYLQKRTEAERYVAVPTPDDTVLAREYPHLAMEARSNGITMLDAAAVILTLAHQWANVSAVVESVRLSAKRAVEQATTPAAIEAVNPEWEPVS